ncbi:MAG: Geranylgeranyl diphosphate synthase [Methanomassiliicoccales archaeon PtaU1.Bin124]|nr:MAG: Geranylgeranyl diphosphate synthase [Methanomassiliicoccales archaeon PtaU1.Bin124]
MELPNEMTQMAAEVHESIMNYLEYGKYAKLRQAMKHYPEGGGKRMRPILAMMVAEAIGRNSKKAVPFGCCLEIIHNFTLVHDDVMDKDPVRRGRPAVHVLFDEPTAIIAGDALFARAYDILSESEVDGEALRALVHTVSETVYLIAEGQQMDIDFEGRQTVGVEEYLEMVEKKTAVLFACAAEGGAIIGGGSERQIKDMKECARLFGIGFQIWDDVLGILGDSKKTGKPVGSDIRNGKRTLIIVHAMENLKRPSKDRDILLAALGKEDATDEEVKAAIEALRRTGSIDFVSSKAKEYTAEAKRLLQCLPECKEKQMISQLIDYSVNRDR